MLPFAPHTIDAYPTSFYDAIQRVGAQSSLRFVVDASVAASYSGSGQNFNDLSGNAEHFVLGDSSGDATNDPAFNGVAGRQSSAEFFRMDPYSEHFSRPAQSWSHALHKNNAVFTWAAWRRMTRDDVNGTVFFDTRLPDSSNGITIGAPGSPFAEIGKLLLIQVRTSPSSDYTIIATGPNVSSGAIAFYAVSYNEATGAWIAQVNGTQATGTTTYVTPTSTDSGPVWLTSNGDPADDLFADAFWTRALSATELSNLFTLTRTKYGV